MRDRISTLKSERTKRPALPLTNTCISLYNHCPNPPPPDDCRAARLCRRVVAISSCASRFRLRRCRRLASTLVLCRDPCPCGCRVSCRPCPRLFLRKHLFLPCMYIRHVNTNAPDPGAQDSTLTVFSVRSVFS